VLLEHLDRLEVLSVAGLLGEAIHRIHHNESVSALFKEDGKKRDGAI
jgi:phosphoribosylpyrophosphate synthetase